MDAQQISKNLKDTNQWVRLLFMILFSVVLYVALGVLALIVFVQLLFALITGKANFNLRKMSAGLSVYITQMVDFLTYNTHDKPFPFSAWPEVEVLDDEPEAEVVAEEPAAKAVKSDSASAMVAEKGSKDDGSKSTSKAKKAKKETDESV